MYKIGEYIEIKRSEKNITQKRLAEILHLSPSAISKWEKGIAVPHKSYFPQIAEALDIPIEELYSLIENNNGYEEPVNENENINNIDVVSEGYFFEETPITIYKNHNMIKLFVVIVLIALISIICLPITLRDVNSANTTELIIIDSYFSDTHEYYGFKDIYYIIVEYEGELTDEFMQEYKSIIREQYSDKFNEASIIIVKFYQNGFNFELNTDPDMKLVIMPN